jgi:hypothetical protein
LEALALKSLISYPILPQEVDNKWMISQLSNIPKRWRLQFMTRYLTGSLSIKFDMKWIDYLSIQEYEEIAFIAAKDHRNFSSKFNPSELHFDSQYYKMFKDLSPNIFFRFMHTLISNRKLYIKISRCNYFISDSSKKKRLISDVYPKEFENLYHIYAMRGEIDLYEMSDLYDGNDEAIIRIKKSILTYNPRKIFDWKGESFEIVKFGIEALIHNSIKYIDINKLLKLDIQRFECKKYIELCQLLFEINAHFLFEVKRDIIGDQDVYTDLCISACIINPYTLVNEKCFVNECNDKNYKRFFEAVCDKHAIAVKRLDVERVGRKFYDSIFLKCVRKNRDVLKFYIHSIAIK